MNGTIKMTNSDKGFGFIKAADGREYFFHRSQCRNCNFRNLTDGTKVQFTVGEGPKGPRAEELYIVE